MVQVLIRGQENIDVPTQESEREHILPSSAFVFSLDLQLIGRGPPSRRRTICLTQPTDSHANTIQRYLENTPRNND